MRLRQGLVGHCYEIKNLDMECSLKQHARRLGIHKNGSIKLLAKPDNTNGIALVKGAKVALSKELMAGIEIREMGEFDEASGLFASPPHRHRHGRCLKNFLKGVSKNDLN